MSHSLIKRLLSLCDGPDDLPAHINSGELRAAAAAELTRLRERNAELEKERDALRAMVMSHDLLKQSADLQAENASLEATMLWLREALVSIANYTTVAEDYIIIGHMKNIAHTARAKLRSAHNDRDKANCTKGSIL